MALPRLQLFEFNDSQWAPALLRDTIVEALGHTLAWGHMLDGLVDPLSRCLEAARTNEVLDLCAGSGVPAAVLARAMADSGRAAHFLLTDLFPHPAEWAALRRELPTHLDFEESPIDATAIPPALGAGRVRVIVNALHHFPPPVARAVLRGACERAPAVFVAEGLVRNPLSFAAMAPVGLAGLLATPVLAKDRRLRRALLTWLSPVALAASVWDGTVSTFRCYLPEELHAMVSDLDGWTWSQGEYTHSAGFGHGSWFSGVRRAD